MPFNPEDPLVPEEPLVPDDPEVPPPVNAIENAAVKGKNPAIPIAVDVTFNVQYCPIAV